jgi:chromosome segregation ATPase
MNTLYLTIPLLLLFGCTNKQDQIKALETEVIQIHDEVMPKNVEINRLSRQLKVYAQDSTLIESTYENINTQIKLLAEAEEAMNNWMVEYKPPSMDAPFDKTMENLNIEKRKIIAVKEMMLSSLESGMKLLDELNSNVKDSIQ